MVPTLQMERIGGSKFIFFRFALNLVMHLIILL